MNATQHRIDPSILRQYDIRGTSGENLNKVDAIIIAERLASILIARNSHRTPYPKNCCALIARDGRQSSKTLAQGLAIGFEKSAIKAIDLGLLPTPALYFAESYARESINENINNSSAKLGQVLCAVMVTGSHNPPQQNGFKIVAAGKPFFGSDIQKLALETSGKIKIPQKITQNNGAAGETKSNLKLDIVEQYLVQLLREDQRVKAGEIQAVWDAGGGATADILKALLPKLKGEHSLLFADIDPSFKARSPDPSKPLALSALHGQVVKKGGSNTAGTSVGTSGTRVGLAFDGDGDRLVVMLQDGSVLSGDRLLLLFAQDIIKKDIIKKDIIKKHRQSVKKETNAKHAPLILCDIKTSPSIIARINELGGVAKLVPSGHANIKHELNQQNAEMAGEVSGHLFFKDRYRAYDDAIYAAVRLCASLRAGLSIKETLAALPASVSSGELRLPIEEAQKFTLVEKIREKLEARLPNRLPNKLPKSTADSKRTANYSLCTLDGVRVEYENAWWLLRASNTEAVIVLHVEASDEKTCRTMLTTLAELMAECGRDYTKELEAVELVYS